jgi:hypothetical protein
MSGIQQMLTGGTYKPAGPTVIGQAFGGGFYAGQISTTANGVADYYLIVAPKATGQNTSKTWGPTGVSTGVTSVIAGPTNSASLAALGAAYQAATFCEGLTIGDYSDWYLPAKNELEVLYYFLKPSSLSNNTDGGNNVNAVSPEPISTFYTSGSPARTSATNFQMIGGGSEAFAEELYWTSSERTANYAWSQLFSTGLQDDSRFKNYSAYAYVRAVRRIPV